MKERFFIMIVKAKNDPFMCLKYTLIKIIQIVFFFFLSAFSFQLFDRLPMPDFLYILINVCIVLFIMTSKRKYGKLIRVIIVLVIMISLSTVQAYVDYKKVINNDVEDFMYLDLFDYTFQNQEMSMWSFITYDEDIVKLQDTLYSGYLNEFEEAHDKYIVDGSYARISDLDDANFDFSHHHKNIFYGETAISNYHMKVDIKGEYSEEVISKISDFLGEPLKGRKSMTWYTQYGKVRVWTYYKDFDEMFILNISNYNRDNYYKNYHEILRKRINPLTRLLNTSR